MSKNRGQSSGRRIKRQRVGLTSNKASKNQKFLENTESFKIKKGYSEKY